jgi:NTE family protein
MERAPAPGSDSAATGRLGLALGSGAARGLAHIGVIRALQERLIKVDCVAGTSIGALIGAAYCAGNLEPLARDFNSFDWKRVASLLDPVFPRSGLIDGQKVAAFLRAYVPFRNVEDLPVPFCAVATDMLTGAEVVISRGDLVEAVRASIAVPGMLTPVRSNGRLLVDGGLVNPVPVNTTRAMGADRVVAVDLNQDFVEKKLARLQPSAGPRSNERGTSRLFDALQSLSSPAAAQLSAWLHREPAPGIIDVLMGSLTIMQARITEANLDRDCPDLLIRPPLGDVRFMDFDRAAASIAIGYETAKGHLQTWSR